MDDITKARAQRALDEGTGGNPREVTQYLVQAMSDGPEPAAAFILIGVWRDARGASRIQVGHAAINAREMIGVLERAKLRIFFEEQIAAEDEGD